MNLKKRFSLKWLSREVMQEDEKEEKMVKAMQDTLEKALPEVVDAVVSKKFEEFTTKSANDLEEIKNQIKTLSFDQRSTNEGKEMFAKTAVVSIFREVMNKGIDTEAGFKDLVDATIKTMQSNTATAGDELVFDQFETDILRVINSFALVSLVKILPINKGDTIKVPKATNGVTTAYVAQAGTPNATDAVTAFVTINIYKAMTLTNMTDELLDDTMTIPDVYDLLVEFIGESQAEFLEWEIISGTGSSAIEGILVASGTNTVTLAATKLVSDITDANLVTVISTAARKYKTNTANLTWLMSQYVYSKIMALKTTDWYPLYPEMRNFASPSLMGHKILLSDKMPVQNLVADVADAKAILFGDFSYFTLARRKGLTVERGYYGNNWRDGIQSLKSTVRVGGKCTRPQAFTILKLWPAS